MNLQEIEAQVERWFDQSFEAVSSRNAHFDRIFDCGISPQRRLDIVDLVTESSGSEKLQVFGRSIHPTESPGRADGEASATRAPRQTHLSAGFQQSERAKPGVSKSYQCSTNVPRFPFSSKKNPSSIPSNVLSGVPPKSSKRPRRSKPVEESPRSCIMPTVKPVNISWRPELSSIEAKTKDPSTNFDCKLAPKPITAFQYFFRDETERILHGGTLDLTQTRLKRLIEDHWNFENCLQVEENERRARAKLAKSKCQLQLDLDATIAARWDALTVEQRAFFGVVADQYSQRYRAKSSMVF